MAIKLVGEEFVELLRYLFKSWLPARNHVISAVNHRFDVCYILTIFVVDYPFFVCLSIKIYYIEIWIESRTPLLPTNQI